MLGREINLWLHSTMSRPPYRGHRLVCATSITPLLLPPSLLFPLKRALDIDVHTQTTYPNVTIARAALFCKMTPVGQHPLYAYFLTPPPSAGVRGGLPGREAGTDPAGPGAQAADQHAEDGASFFRERSCCS